MATLVLVIAGSAAAAPRAWTNASGSNLGFGWSQGQSGDGGVATAGLWGDPTVEANGFFFKDMDPLFGASATFPASANIVSSVSVVMNTFAASPPGAPALSELHVREWGSYTGNVEDVQATGGTVLLVPISPSGAPVNLGELAMTFDPNTLTWVASLDVVFSDIGGMPPFPSGVNMLSVDVTNHLKAIPLSGSASITKEGGQVVIPEPTTFALGLIGIIPIVLRRARRDSRHY